MSREIIQQITLRGLRGLQRVEKDVREIIEAVRTRGDEALLEFTRKFDYVELDPNVMRADREDFEAAYRSVRPEEIRALKRAASNIKRFHKNQLQRIRFEQTMGGVTLGVVARPISSIGIYTPGGKTAYPSSILMCAIPAKVAGVERIIACSPPSPQSRFNPHILVASEIAGVSEIYSIGGAQAVAAMAYGTASIKPVEKIVGPGNVYVTVAKQLLSRHISVDLPAGPSEILIIADEHADPKFIAADLLAQAEHDENAQCILLTTSERIGGEVKRILDQTLASSTPSPVSRVALEKSGLIAVVHDLQEAARLSNEIAPEHLVIMTRDPGSVFKAIRNAGLVFLGKYSPVAVGDYSAGTNHVLPTGGYARTYSGLSVRDFIKTIGYVRCSKTGLRRLARETATLAEIEGFQAHSNSIKVRGIL
ncbi:histidinol dehydrogenase [Candidatus Bathyarchaeota archaeon]|nr:histidinol dehydrogenase [Candidatus Bathyarchaeota archaeon]